MKKSKNKAKKKKTSKSIRKPNFFIHPSAPFYAMELSYRLEMDLENKKIETFVIDERTYSSKDPIKIQEAIKTMIDENKGEGEQYIIGYNLSEKTVGYGIASQGMNIQSLRNKKESTLKTEPQILNCKGIPGALYGINPRNIKGNAWWDAERKKVYASTNYRCLACGIPKYLARYHQWLEAHELFKYDRKKYICTLDRIVPLCHACHNFIHIGRLSVFNDHQRIKEILLHGFKVLKEGNVKIDRSYMAFAMREGIDTSGLKFTRKITKSNKQLRKQADNYKKQGGWKFVFEGKTHMGKSLEQLKKEYQNK